MGNPLKQLAGETAIYGLSTILARIINFLFVPVYTRCLTTESYGVVTEFMAYIAVLQVVLVLGLETGCFRFANRQGVRPEAVYSNALGTVFGINAAFLALVIAFAGPIASWLGYSGFENCIMYTGGILALDSITAILFARLRQEHKAFRFAIFKTIKIITETTVNILLFFPFTALCSARAASLGISQTALTPSDVWLLHFISPAPDFSYVIFAIFASCVVCCLLFLPTLVRFSFEFDGKLLKQMLVYSLPLMVAALPGIINDFLDRILFRFFDTGSEAWRSSLGIYQAAVKLSVIMSLFIQMFRFAAEPFFFSNAGTKDFRKVYASVMEYFVMFCMLIFLGVMFYLDIIQLIVGRDFRAGMDIVPVMLLAYMMMGMLFNVSMWYKLSDRPSFAIYITLAGLLVTAVINIVFLPVYSYRASAWAHFLSYLVMLVLSVVLGRKYYPIPYRWGRILAVTVSGLLLYAAGMALPESLPMGWRLALRTVLILVYLAGLVMAGKYMKRHKRLEYESENSQ